MKLRIERREDKAVIAISSHDMPEEIAFVKAGCSNPNYAALLVKHLREEYSQMLKNEFCRGNHFASKFKSKILETLTWMRHDYHPDKLLEVVCDTLKRGEHNLEQHWEEATTFRRRIRQLIAELREAGCDIPRAKKVKQQ